ncbi:uncharacterized protein LOC143295227 isoform X2 [Babylonia areolata]|uniref:uncharacterized protein LOC143295227 isoform X2 n=1 Tax=Babylonia areolata TaxID=304850 RepID=UPI003FCEFA56
MCIEISYWLPVRSLLVLVVSFSISHSVCECLREGKSANVPSSHLGDVLMKEAYHTSSLDDEPLRGQTINTAVSITIQAVGVFAFIFGLVGNNLMLLVVYKHRHEKRFHTGFIVSLATADLMVMASSLPFLLVDLSWRENPLVDPTHCRLNAAVLSVSYATSIMTVTMISFYRYVKVCHEPLFASLFSPAKNRCLCLAMWLLALLLNSPIMLQQVPTYGYDPRSHLCNPCGGWTHPHYGSVGTACMLGLPLLLVAFFNLCIFRRWAGSSRKQKKTRKRRRAAKATWQSYISVSLTDLNTVGNGDAREGSLNLEFLGGCRPRVSECFSSITSSTLIGNPVATSAREVPRSSEDSRRNDQEGTRRAAMFHLASDLPIFHTTESSADAGNVAGASFRREDVSLRLHDRLMRTSLLCNALDLNTFPPLQCPTAPNVPRNHDFPGTSLGRARAPATLQNSIVPELWNQSIKRQVSLLPDASSRNGMAQTTAERPQSGDSVIVDLLEWKDSEGADKMSESSYLSTLPTRRGHQASKKSLYPSIDRSVQYMARRRKPARPSGKAPPSHGPCLVRSLLVIYLCLFVFYTPFLVSLIISFVLPDAVPPEVFVTATLLLCVNSTVNWVVYGAMNTVFRRAYLSTLEGCFQFISDRFRRRGASTASSAGPATHHDNQ